MMSMTRKRAGVAVPVTYLHAAHTRMRWEPSSPDRPSRTRRPVSSAPWPGIGAFWPGIGALRRSARRSEDRRRARAGDDRGSAARPRSASGWHRVASGRMLGCPATGARLGRAATGPCEGSGDPGAGALVGGGRPSRRVRSSSAYRGLDGRERRVPAVAPLAGPVRLRVRPVESAIRGGRASGSRRPSRPSVWRPRVRAETEEDHD